MTRKTTVASPETSKTVQLITVFVSSPGDVAEERAVLDEICASINRTEGQARHFRLELFLWEKNVARQIGPKPQQVVDQQTPVYNIYLGIMSTRFGTPTDDYGSGTEKEFNDATDRGLRNTVRVREDLLSRSGLLVSRGDGRGVFYHLSFQEFLATDQLFVRHWRQPDGFRDLMLGRGPAAGWRNTLSFLFGCLEILVGRKAETPKELREFFEKVVKQAIAQEIAVKERHILAVTLGRLGDLRIVTDLRVAGHPDEHRGYVKIPADTYRYGDEKERFSITEPFWLTLYSVTNAQYELFMKTGGYQERDYWSKDGWRWLGEEKASEPEYWRHPDFAAPNQPVVGIFPRSRSKDFKLEDMAGREGKREIRRRGDTGKRGGEEMWCGGRGRLEGWNVVRGAKIKRPALLCTR